MNKMGFGFLRLPKKGNDYDWDLLCEMVDLFMERGGDYFDTAYTYLDGMSEEGIRRCVAERKPRASFRVADKLPGYRCKTEEDAERYFAVELERCGVDYFDVFMLHWLNGENYTIAEKLNQFAFLESKKKEGTVKRIGFSYHDNAALLNDILTAHPEVDVVQLQINYLDWESSGIEAKKCYEVCQKHQKPVIVMEPVKGGTLAKIPEAAQAALGKVQPTWSPASWALRFVQSLPDVEIVLSGMNTLEQMQENMADIEPMTEEETNALLDTRAIIDGATKVPCTACGYCVSHCPKGVAIPDCFKMYNEISRYPEEDWKILPSYRQLVKRGGSAADCIACHTCEAHCPQGIAIADMLAKVHGRLG